MDKRSPSNDNSAGCLYLSTGNHEVRKALQTITLLLKEHSLAKFSLQKVKSKAKPFTENFFDGLSTYCLSGHAINYRKKWAETIHPPQQPLQ